MGAAMQAIWEEDSLVSYLTQHEDSAERISSFQRQEFRGLHPGERTAPLDRRQSSGEKPEPLTGQRTKGMGSISVEPWRFRMN
jgi:hypothetical protein